jgi:hypothetical protein
MEFGAWNCRDPNGPTTAVTSVAAGAFKNGANWITWVTPDWWSASQ